MDKAERESYCALMSLFPDERQILKGTLKRVRFASEDGQFSVCELEVPDHVLPVTIVGNILSTRPGESVEVVGSWKENARFGRQFAIEQIQTVLPTTRQGIERYLFSGLIDGIGPVLAARIVDHFGEATLDIIDANPMRIKEVEGIGPVRAKKIMAAWEEGRLIRNVMVFLRSHNVSANLATKIYRRYGHEAVEIIQQNPYRLAEDIFGVGFRTADSIAREAGIDRESMARLRAGALHVLSEAHGDGHMYLPLPHLLDASSRLLEVSPDLIAEAVTDLRHEERVVIEPSEHDDAPAVYRAGAHKVEKDAAQHLRRLIDTTNWLSYNDLQGCLAPITNEMGIELAPAQRDAVVSAFAHKVAVITGGPGTGKTTIVQAVCRLGESLNQRILLAAPTGRAARRLGEATGREAKTVHRLLEYSFKAGGFQYNEERPLEADLLIIDEASMIDTYLLSAIVRALPDNASLLFVGDIDQLPSVGPGNVLGDIIASGQVGVARLTEIFRQAEESTIIVNAHRINR
ncbi:MAG: AAA family ATPase, partial [Bradymonadaceae bacterium]